MHASNLSVDVGRNLLEETVEVFVQKSAVKSVKSDKFSAENAAKVLCNPFEVGLIQKAIDYLLEEDSARVVLVHILKRHQGAVVLDEQNQVDVHTVLLYKGSEQNGKHTISVIDPSNFKFSGYLKNLTSENQPKIFHKKLEKVDSLFKEIKIYTPKNAQDLGTGYAQSRDCADIAVKLAFNFLQSNMQLTDLQDIKSHEVVQRVSNNADIDKTIIDDDAVARIKQSSDIKLQKAYQIFSKVVKSGFDIVKKIAPSQYLSEQNDFRVLVDRERVELEETHYKNMLLDMRSFNMTSYNFLIAALQEQGSQDDRELAGVLQGLESHNVE